MAENLERLVNSDALKNSTIRAIVTGVTPEVGFWQFQVDVANLAGHGEDGVTEVGMIDRKAILEAIFRVHPHWKADFDA